MKKEQRIVAAFSLFVIWIKVFDWLRLFESTAFYIKLLTVTVKDIGYFMVLFLVALAMVGSSMYMLQSNRTDGEEDIIRPVFKVWILDLLLNQYLLGLGMFEFEGFENHEQKYLCWLFFLIGTFFTQITMLNMLIAIMGNTFDMVIEKKGIYAMQVKLQIMSEYSNLITQVDKDTRHYLFTIKTILDEEDEQDENSWEGGFNFLRKVMFKRIDQLGQKL